MPTIRYPNCAGPGRSLRGCPEKYAMTTEQEKMEGNVVQLFALDKNLCEEYRRNVEAKNAAKKKKDEESRARRRSPETWREHWTAFKDLLTLRNSLFVLAVMLILTIIVWLIFKESRAVINSACGGYISATTSGILSTPGYPSNYDNNLYCVWLLVAPVNYYVRLTIYEVNLEGTKQDGCQDYLEIRDGSALANVLYYDCNVTTSTVVKSTSQWLWVSVKTNDHNTYRGFQAAWASHVGGVSNASSPIVVCPWTHFQCANQECISWSWVCDKWNDCGCSSGCDEDGCGGLNYAFTTMLAIGLGSGATLFIVVIVVIVMWDNYQKKKAKRQEEERQKEAVSRKRKQDNMKAVILTTEVIAGKKAAITAKKAADKPKPLTPTPEVN